MSSPDPQTPKMEEPDDDNDILATAGKKRGAAGTHPKSSPTKKAKPAKKTPGTPGTPKTPRQPKTPSSAPRAAFSAIPATYAEASESDRLLLRLKEEGKTGAQIRAAWEEFTGKTAGNSTLTVRITRMKANFAKLDDGDDVKLLEALEKWENEKRDFESTKFQRLAAIMTDAGTQKYNTILLQKELKRIQDAQAEGTFTPSVAMKDQDSEDGNGEDVDNGEEAKDAGEDQEDDNADGDESA